MFVGIDNGLDGAIGVIYNDGRYKTVDMPTISVKKGKGIKREYDINGMREILSSLVNEEPIDLLVLEQAQVMVRKNKSGELEIKQGSVSSGKIMYGYGLWRGLLAGLQIKNEIKHPKTWQKEFFFGLIGSNTKEKSFKAASGLFPGAELTGKKGAIKDGRCDVLLMAEYARRISGGSRA